MLSEHRTGDSVGRGDRRIGNVNSFATLLLFFPRCWRLYNVGPERVCAALDRPDIVDSTLFAILEKDAVQVVAAWFFEESPSGRSWHPARIFLQELLFFYLKLI